MNIVISKIDRNSEIDETDYTSLVAWESCQDHSDKFFAVGVLRVNSDFEYECLLSDSHIDLEDFPFNFLIVHSGGKILVYKYKDEFMRCSYGKKFFELASTQKTGHQRSIKKFLAEKLSIFGTRVFISHASEDKEIVVSPLVTALQSADIDYWIDSIAIKLGDSITEKINEGLRTSEYFVLVLSKSFVGKHFPEKELNSILSMDIFSGKKRIIPVLVGIAEERKK